jgi:hypothetical protein
MTNTIQQLEDLKEWSQDSTRYERRLAFRSLQYAPGSMGTEAGTIPIEWDELSDREREYYRTGPWSTREDFRKGQLVQPGPGRPGYGGRSKIDQARIEAKKTGVPFKTRDGVWISPKKTSTYKYSRKNWQGDLTWHKTPQITRTGIEGVPFNVGVTLSKPKDGKKYQISTKAKDYLFKTEKEALNFYNKDIKKGSGAQIKDVWNKQSKDFQEFFKDPKIYKRFYEGPKNVSNVEDIWLGLSAAQKRQAKQLLGTEGKNIKEAARLTKQGYMKVSDLADELGRYSSGEMIENMKTSNKFQKLFPDFLKSHIRDTSQGKQSWVKVTPSTLKKLHTWAADPSPEGFRPSTIKNIKKAFDNNELMNAWKVWKPDTPIPEKLIHKVLGKKGSAYTMMQLGRVLQGKESVEGVAKNKVLGNKIIAAVRYKAKEFGDWHTAAYKYAKADMDTFLPPGKKGTTFGDYQRLLTKSLREVGLKGFHIDEINALRTGVRGGSQPYSVFSQVLKGKYNTGVKRRFDSENAKNQMKMQKALAMGDNETIRIRSKGVSNPVTMTKPEYIKYVMGLQDTAIERVYEKVPNLKGKIDLVKFDLRDPKTVYGARWKTFDKGVQEAILKNFDEIGYTLNVGKKAKTQKELLSFLEKSKIPCIKGVGGQCNSVADYRKGFNEVVERAAANDKTAISKLQKFTKTMKKLKGPLKWTGYGILGEIGFMVPFAVADYTTGESWKRIMGNASDWGFGPMFGQSEDEEIIANLPEGSLGAEGQEALVASQRLEALEDPNRNFPKGRIGMDPQRFQKAQAKVIPDAALDFKNKLTPFMEGPRNEFFNVDKADQSMMDWVAAQEQIKAQKEQRIQERRDRGFIAEEGWEKNFRTGRMGGGIAGIRRPWAIPPESGPMPQGGGLSSQFNRVKKLTG